MSTHTIQKTAKKWKLGKLAGILLAVVGIICALGASAAGDMSTTPGVAMLGVGCCLGIVSRFGAWMTNG